MEALAGLALLWASNTISAKSGLVLFGVHASIYLTGLAEALLIAAILTGTFEFVTRNLIMKDFQAARRVMTWQVLRVLKRTPQGDEVLEALEEQVIALPFVREPLRYFISLEPIDGQPDFVKLTYVTEYLVKNLSDARSTYRVYKEITLENEDLFPQSTRLVQVTGHIGMERREVINYQGPGLRDKQGVVRFTQDVEISSGETLEISAKAEQFRDTRDREIFIMTRPTLRAEVSVQVVAPLEVDVYCTHPTLDAVRVQRLGREIEWKLPAVLLPGQGFELKWKPRANG